MKHDLDSAELELPPQPDEDDFYFMANLFPATTGLPFVVWISERGGARHDIRVKVSRNAKVILRPLRLGSHPAYCSSRYAGILEPP